MKTLSDSPTEQVDPRQRVQQAALEINRLHAEVEKLTSESKQSLANAVVVAWQAGQLLLAEKKRVRQTCGGAWLLWLEHNFHGTPRTAQRYMQLAETVDNVSELQGLSLRETYFRLGIATEPKTRRDAAPLPPLPPHIVLAGRLVEALPPYAIICDIPPEQREAFRHDLRPLYERLRRLFEPDTAGTMATRLVAAH